MASQASAGRTPRPAHLRILTGRGVRKDGLPTDSGGRPIQPTPNFGRGVPDKPEGLSGDASWLWDRVVEQMTTIGLLKPVDAAALEVACETWARWREASRHRHENGLLGKNSQGVVAAPWIGIEERASKDFRAWAAEFGLTPAAERHLPNEGATDGGDNPF